MRFSTSVSVYILQLPGHYEAASLSAVSQTTAVRRPGAHSSSGGLRGSTILGG